LRYHSYPHFGQDRTVTIRTFENHVPVIAASAYVDATAVVIGRVTIGAHASLWPQVVARGDVQSIAIGARTNIQDGTVLHVASPGNGGPDGIPLVIGADITVGHQAILHACEVGDHCLIGMAATVMDGAVIAPYVILAAGSLVGPGKQLSGNALWRGSPARRVRELTAAERAHIEYSARHYVELHQRHAASTAAQSPD
jgi:carbonic anhydrase/acetyltransferase-like protein (isoleucine patch superfamily)